MIDFAGQVVIVTGAGRGLGRLYALELARRGATTRRAQRFARIFVGLGEGWLAEPDSHLTADDIAAHLAEISATEPFKVPGSIFEEVFGVCERLGIATF